MHYSGIWIVKQRKHGTFLCTFSIPAENRRKDLTNRGQKVTHSASVFSPCTLHIFLSYFLSLLFSYSDFFLLIHCRSTGLFLPLWVLYYWQTDRQTDRHTHTHTHTHTVGLLWTRDRTVSETSAYQHTTLTRDRSPWNRTVSNPQSQQARGLRPTP
jgi:hypothetical protein